MIVFSTPALRPSRASSRADGWIWLHGRLSPDRTALAEAIRKRGRASIAEQAQIGKSPPAVAVRSREDGRGAMLLSRRAGGWRGDRRQAGSMDSADRWRLRRVPDRRPVQLEVASVPRLRRSRWSPRHGTHAQVPHRTPRQRSARLRDGGIHGDPVLAIVRTSRSVRKGRRDPHLDVWRNYWKRVGRTLVPASGTRPTSCATASTRRSTATCRPTDSARRHHWFESPKPAAHANGSAPPSTHSRPRAGTRRIGSSAVREGRIKSRPIATDARGLRSGLMDDAARAWAELAIAVLDLTDLSADASEAGADALCQRAAAAGTAAVCIWPAFVARCVERLDGTGVRVATVINFPTGDEPLERATSVAAAAVAAGADELDVVLPYRAWLAGDVQAAADMLTAVRQEAGEPGDEGDHRVRITARPRRHRSGQSLRHRQRRRLRQDVDRQDRRLGHARGGGDHPRGDRRQRPPRRLQGLRWDPHAGRRERLPGPCRDDHGRGLGDAADVPLRCQRPARRVGERAGRHASGDADTDY